MSDLEVFSTSGEDDSEGSLVDFIVNSEEGEEEEASETEVEDGVEDGVEDVDDVSEITRQYSEQVENEGIVTNALGLRRSMRVSKGRPPARYVDEEFVELMTEDVGSDIDKILSDDSYDGDDESEEFEVDGMEEDD